MQHFHQNIQGYFNYADLYVKCIKELPSPAHIVEIGVWKGCSTAHLAVEIINSLKTIQLDVVDCFNGDAMFLPEEKENLFDQFNTNMKPLEGKINLKTYQMKSSEASVLYDDNSLDMIFIDANHSYEGVKEDLILWKPKLKKNGILAGHDYNPISWAGVVQAVHEEIGRNNIEIIGECWRRING